MFIGRTDAGAETPILWPPSVKNWLIWTNPDAGKDEGRRRRGYPRMRRLDGRSLTWWTWVWASSRNWWWTGRPGMLQSMGSQRVRQDWATKLNCGQRVHYPSDSGDTRGKKYVGTLQMFIYIWTLITTFITSKYHFWGLSGVCHSRRGAEVECDRDKRAFGIRPTCVCVSA